MVKELVDTDKLGDVIEAMVQINLDHDRVIADLAKKARQALQNWEPGEDVDRDNFVEEILEQIIDWDERER